MLTATAYISPVLLGCRGLSRAKLGCHAYRDYLLVGRFAEVAGMESYECLLMDEGAMGGGAPEDASA